MGKPMDHVLAVSDPSSPRYDPASPHYDVTADSSSTFFVGPITGDHKSGDELRAEAIAAIDEVTGPRGGLLDMLFGPVRNAFTQAVYQAKLEESRQQLTGGNLELRAPGEPPRTMWENASHEQMVEVISANADSSVVAVTSEEWVRLGNDLSDHQESFGKAINNSLGNWEGTAGDAARRHLAQVATWLGSTAEGAVLTGRQQEIHSQALSETQRVMADNPPVPFSAPEANARLAAITDPAQFAMQFQTELDTFNQQQAARGQAAAVMHRYDETVGAAATTPRFTAPPSLLRATQASAPLMGTTSPFASRHDSAQAVATALDESGLARRNLPADTTPAATGTLPASLPAAGLPGAGGQGTPPLPQSPGFTPTTFTAPTGAGTPSGVMTPASFTPPPAPDVPRAPTSPSGYPGGGGNQPGNTTTTPSTARPTVPTGPFGPESEPTTRIAFPPRNRPGQNPPGGLPGGVPPLTGGTPGGREPGVSRFGPGSIPGSGPGGVPGGGAPGTGGRGGFGPLGGSGLGGGLGGSGLGGGAGAASGVTGGAAGGPGAPGSGAPGGRGLTASGAPVGGGGAPGGRSRGEDDDEHQPASYLEGDEEVFAPGSVVSPPVIGDWHGNQDWK